MIKYLLAKSSKNDIGLEISNTFDNNLKSPYANFWSEVFVHWERSDGTSEIIRKEIEFVPDSGTHDEIIRFNRFFNINQLIDTNNNRITNDNKILNAVKKRERWLLTFAYTFFLFALIFSKYSPNSVFNGDGNSSMLLYFGGMLFFIGSFAYIYIKNIRFY